jgi:predicted nucleic acid-binding protein
MRVFDASSFYLAIKKQRLDLLLNSYISSLTQYELGNVLWKEVKLKKAISESEALTVMEFLNHQILKMKTAHPNLMQTLKTAFQLKLNYYDASCVCAAKGLGLPLITEDKVLKAHAIHYISVFSLSEISESS